MANTLIRFEVYQVLSFVLAGSFFVYMTMKLIQFTVRWWFFTAKNGVRRIDMLKNMFHNR